MHAGGPVGSGKTALMLQLCFALRDKYNLCAVTNDIFTREGIIVTLPIRFMISSGI